MKKIIITGGCGLLGQYLTKDILENFSDMKIKILDLKENPNSITDFSKYKNIQIVNGKDITDYESIKNEFQNIDTVIHCAGLVSFSLKDKQLLEKVNIQGTANVLKAMAVNKVKNIIHISSVAALGYSDDKNIRVNEDFLFDWEIAKKKKKYYMLTKHEADCELEKFIKAGSNVVVLYPGLMFGPGDINNSKKIIEAIHSRKILFNMCGGTNIVDVRDVSKGIIAVLKKGINNGRYLLSGENLSFKEINKTIAQSLSVKIPKLVIPRIFNFIFYQTALFIESISSKKLILTADNIDSAFKIRFFDNRKAKEDIGWEPKISFKQTINSTIEWMNKNGFIKKQNNNNYRCQQWGWKSNSNKVCSKGC